LVNEFTEAKVTDIDGQMGPRPSKTGLDKHIEHTIDLGLYIKTKKL